MIVSHGPISQRRETEAQVWNRLAQLQLRPSAVTLTAAHGLFSEVQKEAHVGGVEGTF